MSSFGRSNRNNRRLTSLFFDQQQDIDHDDETILASNILIQPGVVPKGLSPEFQQQEQQQQLGNRVDKKRAPKIGVLILIAFFVIGASNYIISSIQSYGTATDVEKRSNDTDVSLIQSSVVSFRETRKEMSKPNLDSKGKPIKVPPELANLADMKIASGQNHEVPIFWHVPRSGGSSLKDIASFCYDLTLASEVGPIIDPDAGVQDQLITVVDTNTGAKFLNVDTTTPEGLERAMKFDIASSQDLDLIVTPYIFQASDSLFNAENQGRFIVLFRHPIDRAVSMYYYLRDKAGIRGAHIGGTLDLYTKSSMVENNWMTRFLTNKMGGELTPEDEAMAKEILRTKCLVGLLSEKTESMRRFQEYFGWREKYENHQNQDCQDKLLQWGWRGKNKHQMIKEGSDAWNLLKEQNTFDIRLYEYAVKLFEVQGVTLFSS